MQKTLIPEKKRHLVVSWREFVNEWKKIKANSHIQRDNLKDPLRESISTPGSEEPTFSLPPDLIEPIAERLVEHLLWTDLRSLIMLSMPDGSTPFGSRSVDDGDPWIFYFWKFAVFCFEGHGLSNEAILLILRQTKSKRGTRGA